MPVVTGATKGMKIDSVHKRVLFLCIDNIDYPVPHAILCSNHGGYIMHEGAIT